MAISLVAFASADSTTTITSQTSGTLATASASGDVMVVVGYYQGGTSTATATCASDKGDTAVAQKINGSTSPLLFDGDFQYCFLIANPTVGCTKATVTFGGNNAAFSTMGVYLIRGMTSPTQDLSLAHTLVSGTLIDSGVSSTLANAAEFAIGWGVPAGTISAVNTAQTGSSGFTSDVITSLNSVCFSHEITAATTAIQAAYTCSSGAGDGLLVSFYSGGGGTASLLARSVISLMVNPHVSGATSVSGAASASSGIKAVGVFQTGLSASTSAKTRTVSIFGVKSVLAAIARLASAARGNASGVASLSAKSRASVQVRSVIGQVTHLFASSITAFHGSLSAATGKASLAARSTFEVFARLSQPGALQLLGSVFIKAFSRLSAPTGKSSLQGKMVMTLRSTSNTTFTQRMVASTRLAVSSVAQIFSGVGLSGTSKANVVARAGWSSLAVLSAAAVVAIRGVATASGKTSLTAKTGTSASARGSATGVLPMIAILGATTIRAAINGALYLFGISPRVVLTSPELRVATAPVESRVVVAIDPDISSK